MRQFESFQNDCVALVICETIWNGVGAAQKISQRYFIPLHWNTNFSISNLKFRSGYLVPPLQFEVRHALRGEGYTQIKKSKFVPHPPSQVGHFFHTYTLKLSPFWVANLTG